MNEKSEESHNMLPTPGDGPRAHLPEGIKEQIEQALEPDLKNISKDQKERILSRVITMTAMFQGPIPPPAMLEHYEEVLPGAADRIVSMAEKALDAQINDRNSSRDNDHFQKLVGLFGGIFAVLTLPAFAAFIAWLGFPWIVAGLVGLTLTTTVCAFLYDRKFHSNFSHEKANLPLSTKKTPKRRH